MPALSVIDLAMFLLETNERPYNIGPLAVLAPPKGFRGGFADKLVERMLRRPMGPPFNYRLQTPRLGLPSLEVDADADPADHVRRLTLDAPGAMAQLFALVCELHEARLDRSRPLWELYVIDGLEGGRVAVYGKVHHGIIDGRTFVQVVSSWLAASPRERTVRALWEGVPRPPRALRTRASPPDLVARVLRQAAGTASSAVGLYRMLGTQALTALGIGAGNGLTLPMLGVPDAFHGVLAADRTFAFCALPIADVKAVAKANGAKVNDLLLAVLDAAMARHLGERGRQPGGPLVADMPLALSAAHGGNQIAVLQFPLGQPEMAPLARLAAIQAVTGRVKDVLKHESVDTVMLYTTLVHAIPALAEKLGARRGPSISNLLVSNPFGLAEERYLMGARAELVLPISVIAAGQMLNITAVTLADKLQIGFLAVPQAVPHVDRLAAYTVDAYADLARATAAAPAAPDTGSTTGRRKRAAPAAAPPRTKRTGKRS
jgi:diacylglycerol O-acyltransferase / wax synthase